LTVVREHSFSKASAKLGISQPAVTQQIKFIEKYLDCKIIERKKNGVILTKEGEDLYRIALRLEKCINNAERDLIKIINKEITFRIGASFTIGNFIIPGKCLNNIKQVIHNDVQIKVELSEQVIDDIIAKQIDLGLIESPIFKEDVIYREWLEDELVVFSNRPLPKTLKPEDLNNYRWICRDEASHTRRMVTKSTAPRHSKRRYSKRRKMTNVHRSSLSSPTSPSPTKWKTDSSTKRESGDTVSRENSTSPTPKSANTTPSSRMSWDTCSSISAEKPFRVFQN